MKELKPDAPSRSVTDVGPGDYVKVGSQWEQIKSNSATGASRTPREWTIVTESERRLGMYDIRRYAKAEDITEKPFKL